MAGSKGPAFEIRVASEAESARMHEMTTWLDTAIRVAREEQMGHQQGDTGLWAQALIGVAGKLIHLAPIEVRGQILEKMQDWLHRNATGQAGSYVNLDPAPTKTGAHGGN